MSNCRARGTAIKTFNYSDIIIASLYVIPACRESLLKKDAGQAGMTAILYAMRHNLNRCAL
jgi:hypothetical protein